MYIHIHAQSSQFSNFKANPEPIPNPITPPVSNIGVSTGRVCAQPELDSILSSGEDFNLQSTRMNFQINWDGSYWFSSVNRSVSGISILLDFG